jgi:SnoaL-like domain
MGETNREILQRDWVDALRERDVERAVARLAPEVAWQGVEPYLLCRSRPEVAQRIRGWRERPLPRVAALELEEVGDAVVLSLTSPDLRRMSDERLGGEIHIVFRLRDGLITHLHDHRTREGALAAAAAPPPPLPEPQPVADLGPPPAGPARVTGMTPFVRVADVGRSAGFYRLLGFEVCDTFVPGVRIEWAFLEASSEARIMLARDSRPVDARAQGVLFYLYVPDLAALRDHLLGHGVAAGPIEDGSPGPRREMRVTDPDGYVLMIAEIEEDVDGSAQEPSQG